MTAMAPMPPHTTVLATLLPELGGAADGQLSLSGMQSDSRQIRPGEAFLALPGASTHGLEHVAQAAANGAVLVLVDSHDAAAGGVRADMLPVIQVAKLQERQVELAQRCYGDAIAGLALVGVTGTNGKTSCCRLLASALTELKSNCAYVGTLGWGMADRLHQLQHTTPDLFNLYRILGDLAGRGATTVAVEVSSHALAQQRCAGLQFDTAVFTNLTRDHLDFHGSMDVYGDCKRRLFNSPGLRRAVVNGDDAFGRELLTGLADSIEAISYGDAANCAVRSSALRFDTAGCAGYLHTPWGDSNWRSSLLGRFNVSNLLAVAATLGLRDIPLPDIVDVLERLRPIEGRMELLSNDGQPTVVIDYAHTPDALAQALSAARLHCQGRLFCVFGAGGDRDRGKRPLMGEIAARHADYSFVTSDNPRSEAPQAIIDEILTGMTGARYQSLADREVAIARAIAAAGAADWVLVAGKGHEDYQEINGRRLPFSDLAQARSALRLREFQS